MNWLAEAFAALCVWVGAVIVLMGGVALAVVMIVVIVNFIATKYCLGHDIFRIALKVRDEKRAKRKP